MIIGVTGFLASGKDTVAQYLEDKQFNHYSLSDELRAIMKEQGIVSNRDNQTSFANALREQYGADYLARRVLKRLVTPAVITSLRTPAEVNALRESKDFILIFVDAPIELRYQRIVSRGREGQENQTFAEFKFQEERELTGASHQQQLKAVAAMADYVVQNNTTPEALYQKIDQILAQRIQDED